MNEEISESSVRNDTPDAVEPAQAASLELKRAYVQLGFGQFEQAIDSCRSAASLVDGHYLPDTVRGAILSAKGAHKDALSLLRRVIKRHPEQALPRLYFAEACFLLGRTRQGERALDDVRECTLTAEERELLEQLNQLWSAVDPEDVPPPLEPTL